MSRIGGAIVVGLFVTGMALFPLRVTGWTLMALPGDEYDNRFNNYILEHGWSYLSGRTPSFWNAPFLYPEPNTLALSDNHLGTLPLYALFRVMGLDPETAMQGWFLMLFVLNFAACYWALRKLGMDRIGAGAGAYVFAFGLPLVAQIGHVQLYPRFFVPIAIYFAWRVLNGGPAKCWLGLGVAVAWQFYATIYIGYFLCLLLAAFVPAYFLVRWWEPLPGRRTHTFLWRWLIDAALLYLILRWLPHQTRRANLLILLVAAKTCWQWRRTLIDVLGGSSWVRLAGRISVLAACLLGLVPLMLPYQLASRDHGVWEPRDIMNLVPHPQSWFDAPDATLVWPTNPACESLPGRHEMRCFLGGLPLLALAGGVAGVFLGRHDDRHRVAGAMALAFLALAVLVTQSDGFFLYERFIRVPGVGAIRGVARICLVVMFAGAVTLAWVLTAVNRRLSRYAWWAPFAVAALVLPLVVLDQTVRSAALASYGKYSGNERVHAIVEEVQRVNPRARMLLYAPLQNPEAYGHPFIRAQLDGMFAGQRLGIPTLNGYTGRIPHYYPHVITWTSVDEWHESVRWHRGLQRLQDNPTFAKFGFGNLAVIGGSE